MKVPFSLVIRIWVSVVVVNALMFALIRPGLEDVPAILVAPVVAILGIISTFPYTIVIRKLIDLARQLPYGSNAQHVWLAFALAGASTSYYFFASIFAGFERMLFIYMGMTAAAVALAVIFNGKKIVLYFKQVQDSQLSNEIFFRNQHPLQNAELVSL